MNNSRNPYFIGINSAISTWAEYCINDYIVAILILLELTLQYALEGYTFVGGCGRNPYFIGINSAIETVLIIKKGE